jgi:hypothetical protein
MRTILWLSLGLSIAMLPANSNAQNFALVPDSIIHALPAKASTPAAQATIASAMKAVNRAPIPVATIQMAGRLPKDPIYDASKQADADLYAMADLALAYRLTGDRRYLNAATQYITAWAGTYQTQLGPIDDQDFYYFFIAHDLIQSDLPPDVQSLTQSFIQQFAQSYLAESEKQPAPGSPEADPNNPIYQSPNKPDPTRINNFQSHRIKLGALAAFATGDKELIRRARAAYERQITVNIYRDGSVIDFHTRDAIDYVTYDLEPLLLTAIAAYEHGQDWFGYRSPSGSSLGDALFWLAPFAEGEKTHQEFVHSTVPFDQTRAKAGLPGFAGPWNPKGSTTTFAYAAILAPKYRKVLDDVEARGNTKTARFIDVLFY